MGRHEDGGPDATDNLDQVHRTQTWLAVSNAPGATVSGTHFYHERQQTPAAVATKERFQDDLIDRLGEMTHVVLPTADDA